MHPIRAIPTFGTLRVRSRYCECDPMGVVHHAAYIPWLEMGRTELLRDAGLSYAELEAAGVFLVIVKLECSYKRPAYYDDLVEVRTKVVGGSRIKIRHEYEVVRAEENTGKPVDAPTPVIALDDVMNTSPDSAADAPNNIRQVRTPGELIMTASSLLACVDRTGRPAAMPDWLVPTSG